MELSSLVFVRHGQSVRNMVEDNALQSLSCSYFQNEADRQRGGAFEDRVIPLTEKGLEQARKTGKVLKETFGIFSHVIHSGYVRTIQTTQGILEAYTEEERRQMTLMESLLIRERDPGYCHNMTIEEVKKNFSWMEKYWTAGEAFFRVPIGGESVAQMCSGRLLLFLNSLKFMNASKVLVVSHGRSILGMRYLLEKWSYEKINHALKHENPPNCAVTEYVRNLPGSANRALTGDVRGNYYYSYWQLGLGNKVFYD